MKKNIYIILVLFFIIISCNIKEDNNKVEDLYSAKEIKNALNIVLDSALYDTYYGKINYDIQGRFNYEYSDSLIYKSLECIDSLISEKDITHIINQYHLLKGKDIDKYIDANRYKRKEGAHYAIEDSVDYQFYLSPPLFTLNKKYFVTYCIGSAIRPDSFTDGFLFVFINQNNQWYLHLVIKNPFTTPENVSTSQSHSFIPVG